ncbi:uncharacterized protein PHACADRAFT_208388 [Phanerochaete carnosa HHB-10118-sp]|uniref:Glucose-methanol-choline oxidoreductase C-terminal domain-containing protein n=1 Tax=Phanerochaete carnosa (strain HHB-10118-sp) TaxID=650164 RepID=K5V3Z5_PHACS|nr:uncharacterized protein PHACADRAFT_208388 [Phanerochaete carnosa HHB-10118-sp]EKM57286.1 hypothetical protein PHACADRAFT_208388 [Phanerochaete carnosa HHB-10118-sp]
MEQKLARIADVSRKKYDFVVVVGGGAAGCIVAAKLSGNPNTPVALLKAGPAHLDGPLVWKINASEHEHEDVGVIVAEFDYGGQVHKVFARKEVIVSARHVLELSGIGDREVLGPLGTTVRLDLAPAGTNVQEHVAMVVSRIQMVGDRGLITSRVLDDEESAEKIQFADPKVRPAIDPHYYEEDIDLDIIASAIKIIRKVTQTEPFKALVVEERLPRRSVKIDEGTYGTWQSARVGAESRRTAYVRENTYSGWHTAGSMSIKPRDKNSVVNTRPSVYGTNNIRVVDLSALPIHMAR